MSKIMVIPKDRNMIEPLLDISDAFLIGVEGLSINLPVYFKIEEIIEIVEYLNNKNKEVFISLNKNIKNSDLPIFEEIMIKLNNLNIKGVFYYDVAVINLWKKNTLNYDLVWAQEHFVTNYDTCNYYKNLGVNYGLLSSEITLEEIIEIIKNTDMKLIMPAFGYLPMFASFRHLVNNYLDFFDKEKKINNYYMEKEGKKYPVIDEYNGTIVYSGNIINGLSEIVKLKEVGLDYILLSSVQIEEAKFLKVVAMFNEVNIDNKDILDSQIYEMFDNIDKGFLYKETVYKVKKSE
ncbi:MAG: U32 family peptidase [Bacilli bacterium]|nr:U32 family peptidase [Bacilli bacterium]